jgi:WD40 repeat protein
MELERAEEIVRELLAPKYLNPAQEMVFRAAWNGHSYRDLAETAGYDCNYIKGLGAQVWRMLATATDSNVSKSNFRQVLELFAARSDLLPTNSTQSDFPSDLVQAAAGIDWGEDMDISPFYGRELECSQLDRWIVADRCRLVAILGMSGIGKTTISIELVQRLQAKIKATAADPNQFSYILWRSLLNAPLLKELLPDLIRTIMLSPGWGSNQSAGLMTLPQVADKKLWIELMPKTVTGQIELLLEICQQYRCLIVLDHGESIFQAGAQVGQYRPGYTNYGDLFSTIGRINHQSCLLITSREKPMEISQLEGLNTKVRSLRLPGLDPLAGQQIFADRGCLPIPSLEWIEIDRYCGGNPLAFQLIAAAVQEVADGAVSEILPYLRSNKLGFADIHVLLAPQWARLTAAENQVMYWLAIARESMPIVDLERSLHPFWNHHRQFDYRLSRKAERTVGNFSLLTVLQSLHRRSIISLSSGQVEQGKRHWSLQPMVMEYAIDQFVNQICTEIEQQRPFWLNTHPIIQATTTEYLRQAQLRLIVQPTIDRLRTSIGNLQQIGTQLRLILTKWQISNSLQPGYLAGNILNLLTQLKLDLTDLDCSELIVRQAYLAGCDLAGVNFTNAQMVDCAFTQTFSSILAIAYSPDGQTLAASDSSGKIRLWCVRDGQCLLTCSGHTNWVRSIKFSPDGQSLASTSDDLTIKLWDLQDGKCIRTMGAGIHSFRFSFSPDGCYIASGSANNLIYYWDLQTGICVRQFAGHLDWSIDIKFHPQGHQFVSVSADRTVRVWDVASGKCLQVWYGHEKLVTTVDYSPDGKTIISGSLDGCLRLWDAPEGQNILPAASAESRLVVTEHGGEIWSAVFSPDGSHFASAGVGGLLRIWQTTDGHCLYRLEGHHQRLWSVAFHPDGLCLASGGEDQTIRVWQVSDGKCLQILNGHINWFRSIVWSPDGQRLITASWDAQIRVWSMEAETCLQSLFGHSQSTIAVAYSPSGLTFASGSDDQTIRIWDAQTYSCTKKLRGHTASIIALVYSPDGKYLVSGGSDLNIRIWDTQQWRCLHVWTGHTDRIGSIAYHPYLDLIASASEDCTVRIWNLHDPDPVQIFTHHIRRVIAVAFDPRGKILASGGIDGHILLVNIETGSVCHTLTGHSGWILALTYSPDGKWLFSSASDHTIRVWSMETFLWHNTLIGHQNWVWSIAISSCARFLASASEDETIRIWDLADGSVVSTRRVCRPYEEMNITGVEGLTAAQIDDLKILGAEG